MINIFEKARELNASDIHLNTKNPPAFRIDGCIARVKMPISSKEFINQVARDVLGEAQYKRYMSGEDIDTAYSDAAGRRYRVNAYYQLGAQALAIRLLDSNVPSIDSLGLPKVLKDLSNLPRGIVVITGPTGSGKSTTLAAMVDYINTNKRRHILTLEDPVEYIHPQKQSIVTQREIHKDADSFHKALRSALREDPDVILVGEMRDPETIQLALTAAETGHLVLSTLHTIGAPDTINRILDSVAPSQQAQIRTQLSATLKGVVSQILLPKKTGGRIAVHEILLMNDTIANNIRQNTIHNIVSVIMANTNNGMKLLDAELAQLVNKRVIDYDLALSMAKDKPQFERFLKV